MNCVLETQNSAYRIIEGLILPVTNEQELSAVSQACHSGRKAIDHHMQKAIEIFSNKVEDDYWTICKKRVWTKGTKSSQKRREDGKKGKHRNSSSSS